MSSVTHGGTADRRAEFQVDCWSKNHCAEFMRAYLLFWRSLTTYPAIVAAAQLDCEFEFPDL